MGLFKGLKKVGKKILKGAKKALKKVGKFVGKIASSKWGKALMIAGSVVMGGIAIYGAMQGISAAGAGATFMGKFAAGAKGMMGALANPVTTGKAMLGKTAALAGATAPGATATAVPGFAELGTAAATPLAEGAAAAAPVVTGAGTGAGAGGGILGKVGTGVLNFAKSAGGGQVLAGAVEGFAGGKAEEERLKQEEEMARYYDRAWQDPNQVAAFQAATQGPAGVAPYAGALKSAAQGAEYVPGDRDKLTRYARGY